MSNQTQPLLSDTTQPLLLDTATLQPVLAAPIWHPPLVYTPGPYAHIAGLHLAGG
jgi:hypothetical protein